MITFREMLGNTLITDVPVAHQQNIQSLLPKVNNLLEAYDHAISTHFVAIVTSGYRTLQHHKDIYKKIFYKTHDMTVPFDEKTVPMGSKHLTGHAVDISDPGHKFHAWLSANIPVLIAAGLYMEALDSELRVHLQDIPPVSGNRIFKP